MESLKDESNLVSDIMRQSTTLSNKISLISSTTETTQNKHVKVLHYFVDNIK
jgi:hypothetical protein